MRGGDQKKPKSNVGNVTKFLEPAVIELRLLGRPSCSVFGTKTTQYWLTLTDKNG